VSVPARSPQSQKGTFVSVLLYNHEVDFVLYGERGLHAIEVKRSARVKTEDLAGLRLFQRDYPMAKTMLLYGGKERLQLEGIEVLPFTWALPRLSSYL
jgi:uncharacterized protein